MITVNGKTIPYEEGMTVARVLEKCCYTFPLIIVRVNGQLVPKEDYPHYSIQDGDEIQALHMMGGG